MKSSVVLSCFVLILCASTLASAQSVPLGGASGYAVFSGAAVTSTGNTVITGDLGVSPGTSITGFGPGIVNGEIHSGDTAAGTAHSAVSTAYGLLAGMVSTHDLTGMDLGGKTFHPGVYHFDTTAQLTGSLMLDSLGDFGAIYVFQIGTGLTTAANSTILTSNGALARNVYWQVGSSASFGANGSFAGNVFADQSITMGSGFSLLGRAFATNAAITMSQNRVTLEAVPEPGFSSALLIGFGLLSTRRRRR